MRVRRNCITGILKLLTLKGNWRAHQGEEPLNKWYTGFDWLSDLEIEQNFPEDDLPDGIHFETLEEDTDRSLVFTVDIFLCWLTEGRYNCNVAQHFLRLWTHDLSGSRHETMYDFFHNLLDEYKEELDDNSVTTFPVMWLARKIQDLGNLAFAVRGSSPEEIQQDIAQAICSEVAAVQAYCRTWQSNASYLQNKQQTVEKELKNAVNNVVYPWPKIQSQPTGYREDGRFSKSYPLEFPFGVGDLNQPRIRNDFSVVDWAQHLLQYYDGRCISSRRGNRLTWAIYNEAMRDVNQTAGKLVHRNTNEDRYRSFRPRSRV